MEETVCVVQPLVCAGVVGVCTYFIHRMHQPILKRQAHIGVQRQTHFTELLFSVALKYIPPGSNPQNVWDAAGHDWHDISSVIWFVQYCDM